MSVFGSGGRDGIWFEVGAEVTKALSGLRQVEEQLRSFRSAAAEAANAGNGGFATGIEQGVARTTAQLREARTQISGFFDTAFRGLVTGVVAAKAALLGVGAAAVSLGQDFEASMTRVAAISGATREELQALTDKAREMGRDLPVSATDAADAFTTLAQRGYDVKTMMGMVDEVTKLSISQQTDMASAADLLGSTMKAFGLKVSDASALVDIYNNACNNSALAMSHFHIALKYVAPNAAALGISLEDTVAAMEALADAGFTAETMGTGLRMVFTRLGQAVGEGGGEFKKLGVKIQDANGKLLPLSRIFENMAQKTLSLAELQKIFGVEAATAAAQLQKVAGSLGTYRAGLVVAGTAQANMARYMETTKVKIDDLRSSIDEIRLSVFDQLKEKLGGVLDGLKGGADAFSAWIKETKAVQAAVEGLAEGLGFGVSGLEAFKKALDSINVSEVRDKFRDFAEGAKALGGALSDLASLVPWQFLIDNLKSIAVVITSVWAVGKVAAFAASITALSGTFVVLGRSVAGTTALLAANPMFAVLGAIAVAEGLVTKAFLEMRDAQLQAEEATRNADDMERWAVDYQRAIEGCEEAFKRLPPHLQKLIEARKEEAKAAQSGALANKNFREALLGNVEAYQLLSVAQRASIDEMNRILKAFGGIEKLHGDFAAAVKGNAEALSRLPSAVQLNLRALRGEADAMREVTKTRRELTKARNADAVAQRLGGGNGGSKKTHDQIVDEEMGLWRARLEAGQVGQARYLSFLDRFASDEKLKELSRLKFLREALSIRAEVNRKNLEAVEKQEQARRESAERGMAALRFQVESEARIREAAANDEIERERSRIQWLESLGMLSVERRLQMESGLADRERTVRQQAADEKLTMVRDQYAAEMRELGSTHVNLQAAEIEHTETMLQIDRDFRAKKTEIDRQAYEDQNRLQLRAQNLMRDADQAVADLSLEFGVGLTNALASAASGMGSLGDALQKLGADIAYTIIRATLLKTILGALGFGSGGVVEPALAGAWKSARGNVVSHGSPVLAFAGGGVVSAPTFFPMKGGRTGLMGEAGPEAIMPLRRGPDGKLGVQSSGGGDTMVHVTIQALDSKSFADMARSNRLVFESMVVENVMRNGAIRKAMKGAG